MADDRTAYEDRPIDELVPRQLSRNAALLNVDAAVPMDFFGLPTLYIPVAVGDSSSARETVYRLPIGQKTLMGIYVLGQRMVRDYLTRVSEQEYACSKETASGQVVFSGKGTMRVLDGRVGAGEIVFEEFDDDATATAAKATNCTCTRRWYVWSFIATENCTCKGGRPPILTS
jgi:hypothetical protein